MPYFCTQDGTKLFYQLFDPPFKTSSPPCTLVLVHGGLVHSGSWYRQVQEFATYFPVLTFDLRGYGKSSQSQLNYEISDFSSDLVELVETLGIKKITLLGFSLGGVIAQFVSATQQNLIEKLVLESTTPKYSKQGKQILFERSQKLRVKGIDEEAKVHIKKAFSDRYFNENPVVMEQYSHEIQKNNPDCVARTFEALASWDGVELLQKISAPTLVLHGELDIAMPKESITLFQRQIPNVQIHEFEETGHTIHYEQCDAFNSVVLDFLMEG